MTKKRRKLKKKVKITLYIILITLIALIPLLIYNKKDTTKTIKEQKINKTEIIQEILSYNIEVDKNFLEWLSNNYNLEILTKLKKTLQDNTYSNKTWHELTGNSLIVLQDDYNQIITTSNNISIKNSTNNTISFVGDVSLADDWYIIPKYEERNKGIYGILSEDIVEIMTNSAITIANNEFTISNRGSKLPNKYYTFRAKPERLSIYEEMGVDLVTLANNHIYDYGETAFLDALDALTEYNIPYIGAGKNIEEAMKPYYFIINGYKIAFVNATRAEKYILTPEATTTSGGVFRCYDPTNFINLIKETKQNSDYLVALVHWGKEDSTTLEDVQIETSKLYIDAGADIIVGTHAHILQGIDFYNNKAIIYNLGDFIFNHETKDTGIFQLTINDDGTFKYNFIPCKQEEKYTYLLTDTERTRVLNNMRSLSPNITIAEDGTITPNN